MDSLPNFGNKNPLAPRLVKLLGHNNETTVGLLMKLDNERGKHSSRYIQVMTVVKMNLEVELDKEDRERNEKEQGIKKKVVLEYEEEAKGNNLRWNNGAVPGTNNAYFYYVHYISAGMILEIYTNKIGYKHSVEDKKEVYEQLANELLHRPQNLTPVPNMTSPKKQELEALF